MLRASVLTLVVFAGCFEPGPGGAQGPEDLNSAAYEDVDGGSVAPYPYGPFGNGVGSVIPNFKFTGYPRANLDKTTMQEIQLADFYNPTGNDVYPPGSPYGAGTPKPKALILDHCAIWCGPCNQEASTVIPAKRQEFASKGGEWFEMLAEGPQHNVPASQQDLTNWVTKYRVEYPSAIDSKGYLNAIVPQDVYPGNVMVRTRDMRIIAWVGGIPQDDFYQTFADVLAGKAIPGIDR
jgi:hypothetical protein